MVIAIVDSDHDEELYLISKHRPEEEAKWSKYLVEEETGKE
jgi:hypothetical protein